MTGMALGWIGATIALGSVALYALEIARLESPVRLAFEFQPPQTAQPKDATHNASLLDVVDKDNSVADLKFRLRFHDRRFHDRLPN
jgi:hypothetical protein